jgi:hypothetical protein
VRLPAGTATPVKPETFTVTANESLLIMMYGFWMAGTLIVPAALNEAAEITKHNALAFWAVLVFVNVRVATLAVNSAEVKVAIPTIACSIAVPILALVVLPQAPDCSPVVINSNLSAEKVLDMICPYFNEILGR